MTNTDLLAVPKESLLFILEKITKNPEKISVEEAKEGEDTYLYVKVDEIDMGGVIGRGGIMASSIKTIISSIARNSGIRLKVRFLEPDGSFRYAEQEKEKQKEDLDRDISAFLD